MIRKKKNGIEWLEFELLADFPRFKHAVFLRHGGVSEGVFKSLNLSYDLGDEADRVRLNRSMAAAVFGVDEWHCCQQHHGAKVEILSPGSPGPFYSDGLATSALNQALMVQHADCQAALFYDPIRHAAAAVHSGWRSSVQNIYANAVAVMQKVFQSDPRNLLVCISPSLGPESAEFIHYKKELPESFWDYQIKPFHFNFWSISEMQLINAGILKHHIQIAKIDTKTNPQDYFSYRYCKIRGGHGTAAVLL